MYKVFDGQHPHIIELPLWEAVQAKIYDSRQTHAQRPIASSDSLLTGILFDSEGNRLSPSHSQKQSKRFRYYLSQKLVNESKTSSGIRIPAQELDTLVINHTCDWISDTDELIAALNPQPEQIQNIINSAKKLAITFQKGIAEQYPLSSKIFNEVALG